MDPNDHLARKVAALAGMGFQRVESPPLATDSVPVNGNRHKVTCSQPSMGTLVSITGIHESSHWVQHAVGLAFQEMGRVVDHLNRYDSSSALSYLNVEGSIQGPPPELTTVLSQARMFYDATQGAFDPTVQPLVDLFRSAAHDSPPGERAVTDAVALVDGGKVEVDRDEIRLASPGMGLTLDGIAKGYVVDRMTEVLAEQGLKDFLINAGGDIRAAGRREDGRPWQVGVQDPRKAGDLPDVIGLSDAAVATSGSYEIYFDRDRTYHHIVSSLTGASPLASQSVSVVAPTTLVADALATAVFVMEPDRGVAFIESFPGCACLIVDGHGRQLRSSGWRSATDHPPSRQGSYER